MTSEQQKFLLAISLYAAFADGAKHDRESEEIRRIAESLSKDTAPVMACSLPLPPRLATVPA